MTTSLDDTPAATEMFVSILGAEAGNLALKAVSTGGLYLAGGISQRILLTLGAALRGLEISASSAVIARGR